MNKSTIVLIGILFIAGVFGVYGYLNETEEADLDLYFDNELQADLDLYFDNELQFGSADLEMKYNDYSEIGYIQGHIGNSSKVIMFECADGVLQITNTTIECVKEESQ